jgi:hypothetical protein
MNFLVSGMKNIGTVFTPLRLQNIALAMVTRPEAISLVRTVSRLAIHKIDLFMVVILFGCLSVDKCNKLLAICHEYIAQNGFYQKKNYQA